MFEASDYLDLLHQLEQYFNDSINLKPVATPISPEHLREQLCLELTADGKPLNELNTDIANYLASTVKACFCIKKYDTVTLSHCDTLPLFYQRNEDKFHL